MSGLNLESEFILGGAFPLAFEGAVVTGTDGGSGLRNLMYVFRKGVDVIIAVGEHNAS